MAGANKGDLLLEKIIGEKNPSGIPSTVFVENVEDFLSSLGLDSIEPLIGAEQQLYSKYKFMEANLMKSKEVFKKRIPETENDLAMCEHLIAQKEKDAAIETQFSLADNVFANATVDQSSEKVCIWLGVSCCI